MEVQKCQYIFRFIFISPHVLLPKAKNSNRQYTIIVSIRNVNEYIFHIKAGLAYHYNKPSSCNEPLKIVG